MALLCSPVSTAACSRGIQIWRGAPLGVRGHEQHPGHTAAVPYLSRSSDHDELRDRLRAAATTTTPATPSGYTTPPPHTSSTG